MLRIAVAASVAALVLADQAVAQPVAQAPYSKADLTGFDGNPKALPDAIHAIEAATGGRVVEIRYANERGAPGFDAAVAKGPLVTLMRVAAPHPNVTTITTDTAPVWLLSWRGRKDVRIARKAEVSLSDAVAKVQASQPGSAAVAAGIAKSASNPGSDVHAYNVLLANGDSVRRVAVDSETGQVIANPRALAGWP